MTTGMFNRCLGQTCHLSFQGKVAMMFDMGLVKIH